MVLVNVNVHAGNERRLSSGPFTRIPGNKHHAERSPRSSLQYSPTLNFNRGSSTRRVREGLLDVDFVRSANAFSTVPPRFSSVLWRGAFRILFFPFAFAWWRGRRLPFVTYVAGTLLYFAQGLASFLVLWDGGSILMRCDGWRRTSETVRQQLQAEAVIPVVLWLFSALSYGHLCAASQSEGLKTKKRRLTYAPPKTAGIAKGEAEDEEEDEEEDKRKENGFVRHHKKRVPEVYNGDKMALPN